MTIERRTYTEQVELRADGDENAAVSVGYAAVFGKRSQNLGGFVEVIAPGAFAKTIQEQDVRALYNHDENRLLGRLGNGTLRLVEDDDGLRYEVDLPDTPTGNEVRELIRRGDIFGSSFGFRVIEDEWGEDEHGFPLRTLRQVSLRDVGPVVSPAYLDTSTALRSLAEARDLDPEAVAAAAAAGDLRSIFAGNGDDQPDQQEDGRESTVDRPLIGWMHS